MKDLLLPIALLTPIASAQDGPPWSVSETNPELSGVIVNEEAAYDGYTFVMPLNDKAVHLLDMQGESVHTWPLDSAPGGWVYLLEDGNLLRSGREDDDPKFRGGGIGGRVQLIAPGGELLWNYDFADEHHCQHHDLEPLPNGNVLAIAWERKSAREAVKRGRDPEQVGRAGFWPDKIVELKPIFPDGAEVVWEWHAWDHLVQDFNERFEGYGDVPAHAGRIDINFDHRDAPPLTAEERANQKEVESQLAGLGYIGGADEEEEQEGDSEWDRSGDWMHTNAIDYHAGEDLIVVSSPELSEIFILDHSTTTAEAATGAGGKHGKGGRLLWRWGNPKNYGRGTSADKQLFYQHNPTFVPGKTPTELRVLVFDNGMNRPDGRYSEVEELVLPLRMGQSFRVSSDASAAPARPSWRYSDGEDFFSAFISGCQRLPNGNTLICSGAPGRIFEVTRDGEVVWDYRNRLGGTVEPPEHAGKAPRHSLYRATRIPMDHPALRSLLE